MVEIGLGHTVLCVYWNLVCRGKSVYISEIALFFTLAQMKSVEQKRINIRHEGISSLHASSSSQRNEPHHL